MATKKVTPKTSKEKPPQVVPLKDVTISFPYSQPWRRSGEEQTLTVTGAQLFGLLGLVGHRLGGEAGDAVRRQAEVDCMSYSMQGLSELLKMIYQEHPSECDVVAAMSALSEILEFMWIGIRGFEGLPAEIGLDRATVTIGAGAAEKAVA